MDGSCVLPGGGGAAGGLCASLWGAFASDVQLPLTTIPPPHGHMVFRVRDLGAAARAGAAWKDVCRVCGALFREGAPHGVTPALSLLTQAHTVGSLPSTGLSLPAGGMLAAALKGGAREEGGGRREEGGRGGGREEGGGRAGGGGEGGGRREGGEGGRGREWEEGGGRREEGGGFLRRCVIGISGWLPHALTVECGRCPAPEVAPHREAPGTASKRSQRPHGREVAPMDLTPISGNTPSRALACRRGVLRQRTCASKCPPAAAGHRPTAVGCNSNMTLVCGPLLFFFLCMELRSALRVQECPDSRAFCGGRSTACGWWLTVGRRQSTDIYWWSTPGQLHTNRRGTEPLVFWCWPHCATHFCFPDGQGEREREEGDRVSVSEREVGSSLSPPPPPPPSRSRDHPLALALALALSSCSRSRDQPPSRTRFRSTCCSRPPSRTCYISRSRSRAIARARDEGRRREPEREVEREGEHKTDRHSEGERGRGEMQSERESGSQG